MTGWPRGLHTARCTVSSEPRILVGTARSSPRRGRVQRAPGRPTRRGRWRPAASYATRSASVPSEGRPGHGASCTPARPAVRSRLSPGTTVAAHGRWRQSEGPGARVPPPAHALGPRPPPRRRGGAGESVEWCTWRGRHRWDVDRSHRTRISPCGETFVVVLRAYPKSDAHRLLVPSRCLTGGHHDERGDLRGRPRVSNARGPLAADRACPAPAQSPDARRPAPDG
jgi:hypothetical protein